VIQARTKTFNREQAILSASDTIKFRWVSWRLGLALWTLACAIILGGSSQTSLATNAILQLAALPGVMFALHAVFQDQSARRLRSFALGCGLVVIVPLAQLLPLPPAIWTSLAGRANVIEMFALTGQPVGWMPMSVSPSATQFAFVSLIPACAVFLMTLLLDRAERRAMTIAVLVLGLISIGLGIVQVARGPATRLRFFDVTNLTEAVGFFANRNHFAALLYVVLVFAAVWIVDTALAPNQGDVRSLSSTAIPKIGWFVVIVVLLLAQAATRSRAGIVLTLAACLGSFVLAARDPRATGRTASGRWIAAVVLIALLCSGEFILYRLMERFASDPLSDARVIFAQGTSQAAQVFMPFGSGLSTFAATYAMFEKPAATIANIYANQAHNEYLQLWLETGVVGPALFGLAAIWFGITVASVWARTPSELSQLDVNIARAASLAIVLLLAHSLVDYPLRTGAMMSVMAFCSALLIAPPFEKRPANPSTNARASSSRLPAHQAAVSRTPLPATPVEASGSVRAAKTWGGGAVEWPDAWQKQSAAPVAPASLDLGSLQKNYTAPEAPKQQPKKPDDKQE
jgi:O-antigen ligase